MALQVRIASPCQVKWEHMTGDERVRFCAQCKLNVFNVKELSEADARALLFKAEGRVCGRVFQRPDGTVLTADCPRGVEKLRRQALSAVAMVIALVAAAIGFGARNAAKSSSSSDWFGNTVGSRYHSAKEALRQTETFGRLINELDPPAIAGDMVMVPTRTGG